MDAVEQYDMKLSEMNDAFGEAMLSLAYLSFMNPHTSVSTKGYKVTPALTKFNPSTKQLTFLQKEEIP